MGLLPSEMLRVRYVYSSGCLYHGIVAYCRLRAWYLLLDSTCTEPALLESHPLARSVHEEANCGAYRKPAAHMGSHTMDVFQSYDVSHYIHPDRQLSNSAEKGSDSSTNIMS